VARRLFHPSGLARTVAALAALSLSPPCWSQTVAADAGDQGPVSRIVIEVQKQVPENGPGSVNELSNAPLSQTPISISVIGADQIQDRGVNSLSAAIRDVPSAGDDYNTFGYVETIQVRGFNLDPLLNFRRDGLPLTNHVPIALENKQAIQIVQGVAGELGGDAAPGGILNFVLKRPTDTPLREISARYSEHGSKLAQGDFGGRLDDGRFGYRVNLAGEDRHPAFQNAWARRVFGSGFFDWRVAPGTLVELEFEHQGVQEISVPAFGLLAVNGSSVATVVPPPIDPRINLNAQPWTQPFQNRETTGSLRLTQQLTPQWELGLRAQQQRTVTNDRIAFPDGCSAFAAASNDPSKYVYPGLCAISPRDYEMDIYQYISDNERRDTEVLDAYVHGNVTTGAVDQELRLGLRSTRYQERYPPYQTYNFVGTINIFAPTALPPNTAAMTPNTDMDLHMDEVSVFDVARFGRGWSTWLALRGTRLSQASHLDAPDAPLAQGGSFEPVSLSQDFVTPFAALGYQPWAGGFAYVSGGEGIEMEQVPNKPALFVNPGQVLPAHRSRQVEAGFKQTGEHDQAFTAALFQIEKPFSDDMPPNGSGQSLRIGGARLARHRGLELSGSWLATSAWRLEARATWLDAVTTESLHPTWVGHATTNVPHLAGVLRAAWQPPVLPALTVINEFTYAGHKAVLPDGSADIPSAWQWDLALRYVHTVARTTWIWRAGIDNVTDRRYWREAPAAPWNAQYLFPAMPRVARVGVSVDF
jgi:iron complex outermembrane receptor protein